MKNKVRVPHVLQVFPEVRDGVTSNMNTIIYSIHGNVNNAGTNINLEIHLSEKIYLDLTQALLSSETRVLLAQHVRRHPPLRQNVPVLQRFQEPHRQTYSRASQRPSRSTSLALI